MREIYRAFVQKSVVRKRLCILMALVFVLTTNAVHAQLKVGDNPTSINKSSVLELESNNQGFLLPRITDTTLINALTPPDATMIYFVDPANTNSGIYIRRTVGGSGAWYKLAYNADDKGWTVGGNTIDPSLFPNALLGTVNDRSIGFITNNLVRMTIDSLTGKVSIVDSLSVGGRLYTKGKATLDSQLVVTDTAFFNNHVNAAKNLNVVDTLTSKVARIADSLYLTNLKALSLLTTVLVHDTISGTVERRNMPADVFKGWVIGNVDTSGFETGLHRISGQGQDADTLIVHGATFNFPGVITIDRQHIAGTKILRDSLLVGIAAGATNPTPTSTLQVTGSLSLSIQEVSGAVTLDQTYHTVVAAGGASVTLPSPANLAGRVYIIKGGTSVSTSSPVSIIGDIEGVVKTAGDPMSIYNAGTVHKFQSDGVSTWYLIR